MKTNFLKTRWTLLSLAFLLTFSLLTLNSCEKDNIDPTPTEQTGEDVNFRSPGDGDVDYSVADAILNQIDYGSISVNEGLTMLSFATDDDLTRTLELIQSASEALNEEIYSSIEGLPEEEVDAMDINDNYAFEEFERNFPEFTSFRAMADAAIEEFFAQEVLNDEEDPSDLYDAIPTVLGTVLNTNGEVKSFDGSEFEAQVHIALLDGGHYTVVDGNEETVRDIRASASHDEILAMPNVTVVDEPEEGRTCCRSNKTRSSTRYITQGGKRYRAKYRVRIRNFSFLWWNIHRASSQLRSRKKQGWWWKKHYTSIHINQQGNVYPSSYYTYTCTRYYYDYDLEQWVAYESTCTYEVKCDQGPMNAATSGTVYTWKHERQRNFGVKVSASDKDGYSGTLRATFVWKGQTMSLSIC